MNEQEDRLAHDMIYEMMYGTRGEKDKPSHGIDFTNFVDTLKLAMDSEYAEEFSMKCDVFGLDNEKLRDMILKKKFGYGKKQETIA